MDLYRHYRDCLSSAEKEAYRALETGLSDCAGEISVPALTSERLSDIATMLRLDNPLLFHYRGFRLSHVRGSERDVLKLSYTMKKAQYEDMKGAVMKRLSKILAPALALTDDEKELYIHDYLVKNVVYERKERPYSHEVTGVLCHGIGVCEGMAKTFKLMCDFTGISCFTVVGYGVAPEENSERRSELHAWNTVFLGGTPYGVDVTFDSSISKAVGSLCYSYYNIPDRVMMKNHSAPLYPIVPCTEEYRDLYKYRRIKRVKEN